MRLLLIILLSSVNLFAQSTILKSTNYKKTDISLTGTLTIDSRLLNYYDTIEKKEEILPGKKSPFLAGLMSAAIPGSGEIYAGNYWKAALFIAVEAAMITTNIIYNKKGDDKTVEFEEYADTYWSAVQYAEWLNANASALGAGNPVPIQIKSDASLKPWERVDFKEINKIEEQISTFSHKLIPYGEQQYYELIGKYHQFKPGWEGYDGGVDYMNYYSYRFSDYAKMHIRPDELYNVASTAIVVLITNHFISAIDAAWTASRYNKKLQANVEIKNSVYYGKMDYYPQLNLTYNF